MIMAEIIINLILFLSLITIGIFMSYNQQKEEYIRSEELKDIADEIGFKFSFNGSILSWNKLRDFSLYSKTNKWRRKKKNVLKGIINEITVTIFDYSYQIEHSSPILDTNNEEIRQTVVLFESTKTQIQNPFDTKKSIMACGHILAEINIQDTQHYVLYYKPSMRVAPQQIAQFIEEGLQTYQALIR